MQIMLIHLSQMSNALLYLQKIFINLVVDFPSVILSFESDRKLER